MKATEKARAILQERDRCIELFNWFIDVESLRIVDGPAIGQIDAAIVSDIEAARQCINDVASYVCARCGLLATGMDMDGYARCRCDK